MSTVSESSFLCHYNMECVLCCVAGDGERMEWVQPAGERCGLAEVSPAGTDEPQWSLSGRWLSDLCYHTHSHGMHYRLLISYVQTKQIIQCGWYMFRGSCISFKLKTIFWQNRWLFIRLCLWAARESPDQKRAVEDRGRYRRPQHQ